MNRMLWIVSVFCLAMMFREPASAGQDKRAATAQPTASAHTDACFADIDSEVGVNPEYVWRLRAYRQLDCAIEILEKKMQSTNGSVVRLSREEAERLRSLAFWAKDAAARIGR